MPLVSEKKAQRARDEASDSALGRTTSPEIELFYSPKSLSLAPHIALEESGVGYTRRLVSLPDGQQRTRDFLRVNPRGRLPVLRIGRAVITEVPAILVTIARLAEPRVKLMPGDPVEQGLALAWFGYFSSSVHVSFSQIVRPERYLVSDKGVSALKAGGERHFAQHCAEIDKRAKSTRFFLGDDYTLVDSYALAIWCLGQLRLNWNMPELYPNWTRIVTEVCKRPATERVLAIERLKLD